MELDNLLLILEMVVQEEVVELVPLREVQAILLQLLLHKELMVEQLLRALLQEMLLVAVEALMGLGGGRGVPDVWLWFLSPERSELPARSVTSE